MRKQTRLALMKVLGSVAIIGFLVTRFEWDVEKFKNIFNEINITWYILSLSGVILVLWLKSIRWNLLLKAVGCDYPFLSAFIAYMASFTIGILTPGRVGEIARLYYVRAERNIDFFHSFKTIVTDRIFDFAILIWFGTAGLLFFYKAIGDYHSIVYLSITGIAMFLVWFIGKLILRSINSTKSYIIFINDSWGEMFDKKMIVPWLLTIFSYILFYVANWLILISLGQKISLIEIGFILSLMSLVTLIPITVAGFGTREVSLIYLFAFYGLAPETAIIFSLLQFLAFFLWGGIIGWAFWLIKPVKLSAIRDDASKAINYLKRGKTKSSQSS
jgi:glycosyltransferase 2 family protein